MKLCDLCFQENCKDEPDRNRFCKLFERKGGYKKELVQQANEIILNMKGLEPVEHVYWINGAEWAEGSGNLCYDCALKKIEEIKTNPKKYGVDLEDDDDFENYVTIGGGYGWNSDSPCSCEVCGKRLIYSLTDEGREQELDHFLDESTKLGDTDMYELSEVFEGYAPNIKYNLSEVSNYRIEQLAEKIVSFNIK